MIREKILVDNLKCGGCATSIKNSLDKMAGISSVAVFPDENLVEFESENEITKNTALEKLSSMGYPPQGTSNLIQKGKSYVSCAIGKVSSEK